MIPSENNDKLCDFARYWTLDGDWLKCKACKRPLIASRDGEPLAHAAGCKNADRQHPWAELRALIAPPAAASGQAAVQEVQPKRTDIVPGVMHCAKCKFQLTRVTLAVNLGKVVAGDNVTEPCPNGCGPLWPITWEQAARDAWDTCGTQVLRAIEAEKALADLRSRLGPTAVAASRPSAQTDDALEVLRELVAVLDDEPRPFARGRNRWLDRLAGVLKRARKLVKGGAA